VKLWFLETRVDPWGDIIRFGLYLSTASTMSFASIHQAFQEQRHDQFGRALADLNIEIHIEAERTA